MERHRPGEQQKIQCFSCSWCLNADSWENYSVLNTMST